MRLILFPILILIFFIGCDSFEEDTLPANEQVLNAENSIASLPNTAIFVDLKMLVSTDEEVTFLIGVSPIKGEVSFQPNALLKYQPRADFLTGSDFFTLKIHGAHDRLIDTDSIVIVMQDSTENIPCFNGALSDNYTYVSTDSLELTAVIVSPLINDGYCPDEVSDMRINFLTEPRHGELISRSAEQYTFLYVPDDPSFLGTDAFLYELELIDNSGKSHHSVAEIRINFPDSYPPGPDDTSKCYYAREQFFADSIQESYLIDPIQFKTSCGVIALVIEDIIIHQVGNGTAVREDYAIRYYPGSDSVDYIDFSVMVNGDTLDGFMNVFLNAKPLGEEACVIATNDSFAFDGVQDSASFQLNVLGNDLMCGPVTVTITKPPDQGEAFFNVADSTIGYTTDYVSYDTASVVWVDFEYTICNGDCDRANVSIQIEP